MVKRWILKEQGEPGLTANLAEILKIDTHLANLLVQRGVSDYDSAKYFFRPSLEFLHDPFLMKDMDKAVTRIEKALEKGEKILIYGDYDVDGTTAVALVYLFLKQFSANLQFYIPDRYAEGYGISVKSIDWAAEQGISLIIALDCGIKAVEKVKYANEKGIDYIIVDHHRPGDEIPPAVAVLDPKQSDCNYPYDELSGCGLGFKLVQAIAVKKQIPFKDLEQYIDLVVISIASDIVMITGENRVLAYYGLKLINSNPRPGVEAILRVSGVERRQHSTHPDVNQAYIKKITISDLVFIVGPRLNASGRIETADNSVKLLVAEKLEDALKIAEQVDGFNKTRKILDSDITQEALDLIRTTPGRENTFSTIIYNPNWNKGVIGIVASRLIDYYYRPTIVFTLSNGLITGSARSIKEFDIYNAIDACSHLLEHFGGHTFAAGLSLKEENFDSFCEQFEIQAKENIGHLELVHEIEIDTRLCLNSINSKFIRILKQFEPFGPGNLSPIFHTDRVVDTGRARIVGKNHLRFEVIHPEITSFPIPAIGYNLGEYLPYLLEKKPFRICYHIEENEWNGNVNLQLNVKDIKLGDDPGIPNN